MALTEEQIIRVAAIEHDKTCQCDVKYRMSCPNMATAILNVGHEHNEENTAHVTSAQVPNAEGEWVDVPVDRPAPPDDSHYSSPAYDHLPIRYEKDEIELPIPRVSMDLSLEWTWTCPNCKHDNVSPIDPSKETIRCRRCAHPYRASQS